MTDQYRFSGGVEFSYDYSYFVGDLCFEMTEHTHFIIKIGDDRTI
jgi:hypothetical protein